MNDRDLAHRRLVGELWTALSTFSEDPSHRVQLTDSSGGEQPPGTPEISFALRPVNPSAAMVEVMPERESILITLDERTTAEVAWSPDSISESIQRVLDIVRAVARGGFRRVYWIRGEERVLNAVGLIQREPGGRWGVIGSAGTPLAPIHRLFGRRMTQHYEPW